MNIAFDAKRAFHNTRGLGNYSRDTYRLLSSFYPENNYLLFNPKDKNNIEFPLTDKTQILYPTSFLGKTFPAAWRSMGMCKQIDSHDIDIYHGLSQELPLGIKQTSAKSVVTMHDAIFMRYPQLYSSVYRKIFIEKNKYSCKNADRIIAISEQTKEDIIKYFDADENKISVVYQGCNNIFRNPITEINIENVRKKYNLPSHFLLNVGAIEKRKNAALIIEALHLKKIDIPLVIVGKAYEYINDLKNLISKYKMENQVTFIHNAETADLPAIYAMAEIFIYPSIFEGFGIPVLEALCTCTPVIASTGTCFEETGGPDTVYINPYDPEELAVSIQNILSDQKQRELMIKSGFEFSQKFTDTQVAQNMMNVYQSL